jgi:hypothetical protein
MIFVLFNSHLPYPFKDTRFKKMQSIFLDRFYKLFLPEDKKYFDLIEKADKVFEKKDYHSARKLYLRAKDLKP